MVTSNSSEINVTFIFRHSTKNLLYPGDLAPQVRRRGLESCTAYQLNQLSIVKNTNL